MRGALIGLACFVIVISGLVNASRDPARRRWGGSGNDELWAAGSGGGCGGGS